MSVVEYRVLLYQFCEEIDWQTQRRKLIFIFRAFLPDDSEEGITDTDSLLTLLEEKNLLGIDRLNVMKELLKGIRKWDLLRMVRRFEIKRKDYKQLLEQISRDIDETNELERLISICKEKNLIALESEEDIVDVNALFTVLEQQNNLGIEDLTVLKTLANMVGKPDLCRLLEEFEKKRKQEEDAELESKEREDNIRRTRAQAASVLSGGINIGGRLIGAQVASVLSGGINIGGRIIGVVTPHCTFRNLTGGAVVVTTCMVLRRSNSLETFVTAFKEAVLPFGNFLRALSEGSIRFTVQAENVSALDALWQSYQDETLQKKLQEFLVTEEIKQLAGSEVMLTVHIDEDEYRNAMWDLMISETEEMKFEEKGGLKARASSDSDLLKEGNVTPANTKDPSPEGKFLPFDRKVRVEEYLENLWETFSEITLPSDSGVGTWSSAASEDGFNKEDRLEKFDQVEGLIEEAIENWNRIQEAYKDASPFEGRKYHSIGKELKKSRMALGTLREMEKVWMNAESILTSSSSAQAIIQQLEKFLHSGEDYFRKPTSKDKTSIRVLARKAKNLKRLDVYSYLREITPPGTTGPRLPENMFIKEIPEYKKDFFSKVLKFWDLTRRLDLGPSDMKYPESTTIVDIVAMRHDLKTVGELYDFLCERGLPTSADIL